MSRGPRALHDARPSNVIGRTILLCFLVSLCEGFDIQTAGVSASGIISEFAPSARLLGFIFSASTLGLLIGAFIGGGLADIAGRKTVLIASIVSFGVGSLLTAAAPDVAWLACARFATGLGLGGALPSVMALGSEADANASRRSWVAILYSGAPVGAALASLVSLLVGAVHWRGIFVVGGIMPLALAPVVAAFMSESAPFLAARNSPARIRAILSGRTLLLWLGFCLGLLTLYLLLNWLPTLLVRRGLSREQAATAQIGFNLGGAFAILIISRLLDSRSRRAVVLVTFAAIPCLLTVLALISPKVPILIADTIALGGAVLASQSIVYALAPLIYPTSIRGAGLGAAVGVGRLGAIAGPVMVGLVLGSGLPAAQVFLILVPLVIVAGVGTVWLDALTREL
jgi:MFS transporter, AAHS family, 3-hydroxyphenylpropionic acid transporter